MALHATVKLFRQGFSDLIPLDGKKPTIEKWTEYKATKEDAERWAKANSNVGLLAKRFPGIDCDVTDTNLSLRIRTIAREVFGVKCPIRVGQPPKWLMVTRLSDHTTTIKKMKMSFFKDGETHHIEILGDGQQYVVGGIHPGTKREYEWEEVGPMKPLPMLNSTDIPEITQEKIDEFFAHVKHMLEQSGWETTYKAPKAPAPLDPTTLYAPSLQLLRGAMATIPNTERVDRDAWVSMAHALYGATRPEWGEAGLEMFELWSARWPVGNDSAENERIWRTIKTTTLGWDIIRFTAEKHGWDGSEAATIAAQNEFVAVAEAEVAAPEVTRDGFTFADSKDESKVAKWIIDNSDDFFATSKRDWFCWDGKRWKPDEMEDGFTTGILCDRLCDLTEELIVRYKKGNKKLETQINKMRSTGYAGTMFKRMTSDRRIFRVRGSVNNHDEVGFLLCTPKGIIDLRTGEFMLHDPGLFITQITNVEPVFSSCPVWQQFMLTSCGGDDTLVAYVQSVLGSALTTDVSDRFIWFLTGVSGSGKSTMLKHVHAILGDYAGIIPQGALIHGDQQAHTSAVAGFRDKRFLHGSEIDRGHRWNISLMKSITGNEPITARRLYRHYEEFNVVGKIIIAGNETPTLPNVDSAVRARLRIIPFSAPLEPDVSLDAKIIREYPDILGWLIEGAQQWAENGYPKTEAIEEVTENYFSEEDLVTQFCNAYFTITGNPQVFVPTTQIEQLWNQYTTPEQRKEYNLKSPHTLVKAIDASHPKLSKDQRRFEGSRNAVRGVQGMSLREGVQQELTVEDLL